MASTTTSVSLKLLIDTKSKRVLFAEAGKDFVDFLFNLLTLPVRTVIWLLTKNSMVGSLGNLYGSIEELDNTYLQTIHSKDSLLEPKASVFAAHVPLLPASANMKCYVAKSKKIYMCSNQDYPYENCSYTYVSTDPKTGSQASESISSVRISSHKCFPVISSSNDFRSVCYAFPN